MNFFASPEYLAVAAEVYFPGRQANVEDVRIGDEVLRLLVVDKNKVVTKVPFLDYHEPLRVDEIGDVTRAFSHAKFVVRNVIDHAEWEANALDNLDVAPFIDWSKFPTFDDYKSFIKKRPHVKEYWRRGRRFVDEVGALEFRMDDQDEDVFEFARQWKSQQLIATGQRDYFADPKNVEFFKLLRERGLLTSSTLRSDGRLLSAWLGFIHDGVWSGWVFTYDQEFRKYSVGHLLVNMMLQKSHELKHREFNFSIGGDEYKSRYATHVRMLGPIGQLPLSERIYAAARQRAKQGSPLLINLIRALRRVSSR
jgi:CelD/BcsL family acetyltransferase involved in cellulose biosynthesis